jgi:hypothetical protein
MRPLRNWGFLATPEGAYMRWRDFTPFFWRTRTDRIIRELEQYYKREYNIGVADGRQMQLNDMRKELGMDEVPLPSTLNDR